MNKVILNAEWRAKLNGLNEHMEIYDELGRIVGHILPEATYQRLDSASEKIPFSTEEIERRRNETGGCSLTEFWKRLG